MNNCPGRRGQTVQVGAIVLLGFVVLAVTIFQAQGVPQETTEAELEHNQEVADQLETLSVALAETTATGTPQTTELTLGTEYPSRLFFVYPPSTAGTLETTAPKTVEIENAVNESGPFDNYWNNETRKYNTSSLRYTIDYRELRDTPTYTFEYGLFVAEFEENTTQNRLPEELDKPLINGTDISLVVYDGERTEQTTSTETVVVERVTNETTVGLNADGTDPITVQLPTKLDENAWNETLEPDSEPYIESFFHDDENETVTIELDNSEQYDLTLHKVDVGPSATQPEAKYLKLSQDDNITVRNTYNDRVDETVGAWVYNETSTLKDTLQIPPEGITYETDGLDKPCVTIEKDIENAASYETLDIGESGGCP